MTASTAAAQVAASPVSGARPRLLSLDVFRGLTIAAMILVNNPGADTVYWPLEHAEWNGWTPTDLIFPFFLFIVGVSMTFSFARRSERGDTIGLLRHSLYRSAILFAIGLFLNAFPSFDLHTLRIPGVLQRIALCYLFGSIVLLTVRRRGRIVAAAALLIGYWLLLRFVPVPGHGAGNLAPEGNLGAFLDRAVFGHHLWEPTWDPEGLLSTLPAIATVLFGTFAGDWLRSAHTGQRKAVFLAGAGIIAIVAGCAIHPWFPINKNLWTGTFSIFTAGFACVVLALCYWVVDVRGWRAWTRPLVIFGVNPILAYGASFVTTRALVHSHVTWGGQSQSLYRYVFQTVFAPLADPKAASLLFSSSYVLFWLAIMWAFYAKRIFLKI